MSQFVLLFLGALAAGDVSLPCPGKPQLALKRVAVIAVNAALSHGVDIRRYSIPRPTVECSGGHYVWTLFLDPKSTTSPGMPKIDVDDLTQQVHYFPGE